MSSALRTFSAVAIFAFAIAATAISSVQAQETTALRQSLTEAAATQPSLDANQVREELLPFKRQNNLDYLGHSNARTKYDKEVVLSVPTDARLALKLTGDASQGEFATRALSELNSQSSRGQRYGMLDKLVRLSANQEAVQLAKICIETESDPNTRDLLRLVSARSGYLAFTRGVMESYSADLALARQSKDAEVKAAADLWAEAVSDPDDAESLKLSYQVFRTLQVDLGHRDRAHEMACKIASNVQEIYEAVQAAPTSASEKQEQLLELISIGAQAGYISGYRHVVKWVVEQADALPVQPCDATLMPHYYKALLHFAGADYEGAIGEYKKVFFSDVSSEMVQQSGEMMVSCYLHLSDNIGAAAMLELVDDIYPPFPARQRALRSLRQAVETRLPQVDRSLTSAFKIKHYGQELASLQQSREGNQATVAAVQ
jgi:hypothetical protein